MIPCELETIQRLGTIPIPKARLEVSTWGSITPGDMARIWRVSRQCAYDRASQLCAMGHLVRIKQGHYRLPETQAQRETA